MSAAPRDGAPSTDQRLKVVVVTPKAFLGGAERWLVSVLKHAPRLDPVVVCLQDGQLVRELRSHGIEVIVSPTGATGPDIARASRRMGRLLGQLDPDAILANGIKAATVALWPARSMGIPIVWVRHEGSYEASLGRLAMEFADRSIVVAPPSERDRRFDPVLIPPPLLAEPLPQQQARKILSSLGVPDDGLLRVGMFTRLARYKGVDTALRALAEPGGAGWRLVVAGLEDPGQPDEQRYLSDLATELAVSDRVTWLGPLDDAGRLASGMDCVAVPTRDGVAGYPPGEGFGMAVVEAFAAGVPVLADPRTVPALSIVGYDEGARLIDCADARSLAEGLRELADQERRAALGQAAVRIASHHPRPSQVAADVTDTLCEAAHRPGAGLDSGPAVTVVTTVRNEADGIEPWLDSILAQLRADDQVIVVDGGSTDGTVAHLRRQALSDSRLTVIEAPGAGISQGRNIGIEAATTEWVACTDAGCQPEHGWLEALRRAAASRTADLVTGVYRVGDGAGRPWEIALAAVGYPVPEELRRSTPWVRAYGRVFGRAFDAALPTGRSVAFTKDAWRAAGGYPEDLATAEDVLFGKRAVAAGARAQLALDAVVTWQQRPSLEANAKMYYNYGRGGGRSREAKLVARDLLRASAYAVAPVLWQTAPRTRPLLALGGVMYVSLPLQRVRRRGGSVQALAMVAPMAAVRDLSKVAGCLRGLTEGREVRS